MKILVSRYALTDKSSLKSKWSELYLESKQSAFLDWYWIYAWLNSIPNTPTVIEATRDNKCVGLGLLCHKTQRVLLSCVTIEQLWLHRCGDDKLDQSWIEHNDFLLHEEYGSETRKAILTYIQNSSIVWQELYLGLSTQDTKEAFANILGSPRPLISSPDFEIDLGGLADSQDYLASLSKNTRSQINRSLKSLNNLGELRLQRAQTKLDKELFFNEMAKLHQQKWRSTILGSGFDNPVFVKFHKQLIFDSVKFSDIYALSLNKQALSYVYILKNKTCWYFYLSGMQTHEDNKIRIGLITHTLVIEEAIKAGIKKYSFLAGDARYKKSMSNSSCENQSLVCFYKPTFLLTLREYLRQFKARIFQQD